MKVYYYDSVQQQIDGNHTILENVEHVILSAGRLLCYPKGSDKYVIIPITCFKQITDLDTEDEKYFKPYELK